MGGPKGSSGICVAPRGRLFYKFFHFLYFKLYFRMNQPKHPPTGLTTDPQSRQHKAALFSEGSSFLAFIFAARVNRRYLWFAMVGSIIQLTIFKICYPFPDFISDSYNYIQSAANHLNVNLWPIGYAKFLAFVHQINYSDTLLISIQYILLQASLLCFFYTVKYLYRPSGISSKIIFIHLSK